MIPYGQQSISEQDIESVKDVLQSDLITQGPKVKEFEDALCDHFGCSQAVAVNNGTMALQLAYKALGVSQGDEVVTTPNTFVATANGIVYNDGHPKFVDIDSNTFNLDADKLETFLDDPKNRENLVGIAPVHFAGLPCVMGKIYELAQRHDLFVLEDACHAPGAGWRDSEGQWHKIGSCSHSDAAVMSFHPVKHFTTGEGGAVLTNDHELADKVRQLRTHGITNNPEQLHENHGPWYYEMQELGYNGRITDFQCALGIQQLDRLDEFVEGRRKLAGEYDDFFGGTEGITSTNVPDDRSHAYHLYVIRTRWRDQLFEFLRENDVAPQVHYIPVHLQPYYREHFEINGENLHQAEAYYEEAVSIPMYSQITQEDKETIFQLFERFIRNEV
ncbi:MAG: UDP-4-amino-4,6-dideoxy-N-acetyl-beta-L-altrosamine transaminase [bacterium]